MARIVLTQGYFATVDDEDVERLSTYRWKILKAGKMLYASRTVGRTGQTELMHRAITGAKKNEEVDHKNSDGLDNQKNNLRLGTRTQNLANSRKTRGRSRFKGVYWNKEKQQWQAQIGAGKNSNGRQLVLYLGRFTTEKEAAKAYDKKARELHGEFARLNFEETQ